MEVELYNEAKEDPEVRKIIASKLAEYNSCGYTTKEEIGKRLLADTVICRDIVEKQTKTILFMDKEMNIMEDENKKLKELISEPDKEKIEQISDCRRREVIVVNSEISKKRLLKRMEEAGQSFRPKLKE